MGRRNFVQVLESAGIDIKREYSRLLTMFYEDDPLLGSVASEVAEKFYKSPFVGTCISLDDFDETYGFRFEENPRNFDLDYFSDFL